MPIIKEAVWFCKVFYWMGRWRCRFQPSWLQSRHTWMPAWLAYPSYSSIYLFVFGARLSIKKVLVINFCDKLLLTYLLHKGWHRAEVVWSWEDRTFFSSSPFCQLVMKINGPRRITAAAAACSGDGNTMLTFLLAKLRVVGGGWGTEGIAPPTSYFSLDNSITFSLKIHWITNRRPPPHTQRYVLRFNVAVFWSISKIETQNYDFSEPYAFSYASLCKAL